MSLPYCLYDFPSFFLFTSRAASKRAFLHPLHFDSYLLKALALDLYKMEEGKSNQPFQRRKQLAQVMKRQGQSTMLTYTVLVT